MNIDAIDRRRIFGIPPMHSTVREVSLWGLLYGMKLHGVIHFIRLVEHEVQIETAGEFSTYMKTKLQARRPGAFNKTTRSLAQNIELDTMRAINESKKGSR